MLYKHQIHDIVVLGNQSDQCILPFKPEFKITHVYTHAHTHHKILLRSSKEESPVLQIFHSVNLCILSLFEAIIFLSRNSSPYLYQMIEPLPYELFQLLFILMIQHTQTATKVSKSWKYINEVNSVFFIFYVKPKIDAK